MSLRNFRLTTHRLDSSLLIAIGLAILNGLGGIAIFV